MTRERKALTPEQAAELSARRKTAIKRMLTFRSPVPPPRPGTVEYRTHVDQNIAVAGFGSTRLMKYRWWVTREDDGRIVKAGYGFTAATADMVARRWADTH